MEPILTNIVQMGWNHRVASMEKLKLFFLLNLKPKKPAHSANDQPLNFCGLHTLPETNIVPENRPLEKEILIGNHHFQLLC